MISKIYNEVFLKTLEKLEAECMSYLCKSNLLKKSIIKLKILEKQMLNNNTIQLPLKSAELEYQLFKLSTLKPPS